MLIDIFSLSFLRRGGDNLQITENNLPLGLRFKETWKMPTYYCLKLKLTIKIKNEMHK